MVHEPARLRGKQVEATTSAAPLPAEGEAEARFASQFIQPRLTIADACGLQTPMHWLRPKAVIDLQSALSSAVAGDPERWPENATRPDLVVAFDIMDKLPDPAATLRRLGALDLPILCSYRLTPD